MTGLGVILTLGLSNHPSSLNLLAWQVLEGDGKCTLSYLKADNESFRYEHYLNIWVLALCYEMLFFMNFNSSIALMGGRQLMVRSRPEVQSLGNRRASAVSSMPRKPLRNCCFPSPIQQAGLLTH